MDRLALDTNRQNSIPLGVKALSRQTCEVSAGHVRGARSDLRGVARVPTGMDTTTNGRVGMGPPLPTRFGLVGELLQHFVCVASAEIGSQLHALVFERLDAKELPALVLALFNSKGAPIVAAE